MHFGSFSVGLKDRGRKAKDQKSEVRGLRSESEGPEVGSQRILFKFGVTFKVERETRNHSVSVHLQMVRLMKHSTRQAYFWRWWWITGGKECAGRFESG